MFHTGLCPKCEKPVTRAKLEMIDLISGTHTYKGISYLCPDCRSVLSVSLDHLTLTADIANAVATRLGKD
jgi:hypothetical protein